MPKFSILIPAYKDLFLKKAIDSIISQTFSDFEIIVVDDASPYRIKQICETFHDDRLKYYRNEHNCGAVNVVDNWNICLSYCTGDYVICMGDDDMLLPVSLEECFRLIVKYPEVILFHARVIQIDDKDNPIAILPKRKEREDVLEFVYARLNGYSQYIGDFCFKVEPLRAQGGFYKLPLAWGSDDISAMRAAEKYGVVNAQIPTFQYRINDKTITSTGNVRYKLSSYAKYKKWLEQFLKKYMTSSKEKEQLRLRCLVILHDTFNTWMRGELLFEDFSSIAGVINCLFYASRYNLLSKTFLRSVYKKTKAHFFFR